MIATNSIVSGTRKDLSVWEQYIDCMMNGLSIRKTAVACGIHRNTAFLWRHKILDALQNMADDVTLDGIIEADETFFAISYKGNHSKSKTFAMPRKAHKRGHSTHIRIHVVRNGHRKDGTQRYVCKDCGKSFVIATNSIVSGTRKDLSVWEQYIDCMMNGLSIRKTAVACGIHRNTAFLWRHKILDALQNMADDVTLDGIIEADETFFAISYKGNHSKSKTFAMPRKAHKRGHSTHIRGLSQEKVCVPCAVNRNGLSISKITNTGRVSTRDLHHIYDGRIKTNSTLVTDKMNSYVRFTNANGIDLVQLKTGKAKKGIYNIQHINSYHSQLKRFMRGFNGVSTKYLNNYLVWNNLVNYAKESDMEKRNIFLTFVLATLKTAKCRDLSNRPAVPLVA
ncbi:MAG: IS1595 family transposase [Acutalibacter sp.]